MIGPAGYAGLGAGLRWLPASWSPVPVAIGSHVVAELLRRAIGWSPCCAPTVIGISSTPTLNSCAELTGSGLVCGSCSLVVSCLAHRWS